MLFAVSGCSQAGKTTLCEALKELGFVHMPSIAVLNDDFKTLANLLSREIPITERDVVLDRTIVDSCAHWKVNHGLDIEPLAKAYLTSYRIALAIVLYSPVRYLPDKAAFQTERFASECRDIYQRCGVPVLYLPNTLFILDDIIDWMMEISRNT